MPDRTGLSNIIAAAVHGRPSTVPDQFGVPATGDGAVNAETAANLEPADLSLAGHLLLPVAIFAVTLLTLDFLLSANFAATIWPANAIVLVALLRHTPQSAQLRLDHHRRYLRHCARQRRHRR